MIGMKMATTGESGSIPQANFPGTVQYLYPDKESGQTTFPFSTPALNIVSGYDEASYLRGYVHRQPLPCDYRRIHIPDKKLLDGRSEKFY